MAAETPVAAPMGGTLTIPHRKALERTVLRTLARTLCKVPGIWTHGQTPLHKHHINV